MCFLCLPNRLLRNSGKFEFEIVPDRVFRLKKKALADSWSSSGGSWSSRYSLKVVQLPKKKKNPLNMRTSRENPSNVFVPAALPYVCNGWCYGSVSAEVRHRFTMCLLHTSARWFPSPLLAVQLGRRGEQSSVSRPITSLHERRR